MVTIQPSTCLPSVIQYFEYPPGLEKEFTLGEVVEVLGHNPYASRRVPASHRGRVGGISSVIHSIFSSCTQYLISFLLIATGSNYRLIWMVFMGCGLVGAVLYGFMYGPDKRTFPKLYQK